MSTTNEVLEWVRAAEKVDLDLVTELIKIRRTSLARTFKPGDRVKFDGGRGRGVIRGKFVKLLQKNASVQTDAGLVWRVSPGLLEVDDSATKQTIVPPG